MNNVLPALKNPTAYVSDLVRNHTHLIQHVSQSPKRHDNLEGGQELRSLDQDRHV